MIAASVREPFEQNGTIPVKPIVWVQVAGTCLPHPQRSLSALGCIGERFPTPIIVRSRTETPVPFRTSSSTITACDRCKCKSERVKREHRTSLHLSPIITNQLPNSMGAGVAASPSKLLTEMQSHP